MDNVLITNDRNDWS